MIRLNSLFLYANTKGDFIAILIIIILYLREDFLMNDENEDERINGARLDGLVSTLIWGSFLPQIVMYACLMWLWDTLVVFHL